MKRLNVAIIGQGRSGRGIHGGYFLREEGKRFCVKAVVDKLEDRRKQAQETFHCDTYDDYQKLYDRNDIDLVINATYSYLHSPITLDFLQHGFHVIVEKPFARYVHECDDMIQAAKRNHVMLAVFQQSRFAPYYRKIREIVDSGALGRIIQVSVNYSSFGRRWDWQCCQDYYGGSLLNTGPHPMDQVVDLLDYDGMPVVFSRLDRVNTFGDAEDYAKIIVTAPERPLFDIEVSSCNNYAEDIYKIQGSNGSLRASMKHCEWKYFKPEELQKQHLILNPLTDENGKPGYCREEIKWYENSWDAAEGHAFGSAVDTYYEHVYEHLINGVEFPVKNEKVKQQIAIAEVVHNQNPLSKFVEREAF